MKYLGFIDTARITINKEYNDLFPPHSDAEYNDLFNNIKNLGTIHTNLIVEKGSKDGNYIVLAGHTRLKIAKQLGMFAVPCSLAETLDEKYSALFDNILRRQLSQEHRTALHKVKERMISEERINKIPQQLFKLYMDGLVDDSVINIFSAIGPSNQDKIIKILTSVETKEVPHEETEQYYLKKIAKLEKAHNDTIEKLKTEHNKKILEIESEYRTASRKTQENIERLERETERSKNDIIKLDAEKSKVEEELKKLKKLQQDNKEKLEEAMRNYQAEKDVITEQVRKEYLNNIEEYEQAKIAFNAKIKAKDDIIEEIKIKLDNAKLNLMGKQTELSALIQEVNAIKQSYNNTISRYSRPTMVKTPLMVVDEYIKNILILVKEHKWFENTISDTEELIDGIMSKLNMVLKEMRINLVKDEIGDMAKNAVFKAEQAREAYIASAAQAQNANSNGDKQLYDNVINFNK